MKTMSPIEAHEQIESFAKNGRISDHREVARLKVGEWCRQGDCYLTRIDGIDKDWQPNGNRQLAPGTSPGSRHVVTKGPVLYVSPEANPVDRTGGKVRLLGPQIHAEKAFTVEHPEHAHLCMPPGDYQVSYQLDFNQQRAVRD